jgi:hypothetical protein
MEVLKVGRDSIVRMDTGREFQKRGAEQLNPLSPIVDPLWVFFRSFFEVVSSELKSARRCRQLDVQSPEANRRGRNEMKNISSCPRRKQGFNNRLGRFPGG